MIGYWSGQDGAILHTWDYLQLYPTRKFPQKPYPSWDPFLGRPGNLTGPKSDFDFKVSRKVGRVLTSDEVHFVSLADNFTIQFSNLLKISLGWKTKQLNGPGNYRELRETGPWLDKSQHKLYHINKDQEALQLKNNEKDKESKWFFYI